MLSTGTKDLTAEVVLRLKNASLAVDGALPWEPPQRCSRGRRPPLIRFPDRHFAGFPCPLCAPPAPHYCASRRLCVSSRSLCAGKLTQSIFSLGDRVLGDAARLDDACPGDYSYYDGSCYKL